MLKMSEVVTVKNRIIALEELSGGGGDIIADIIARLEALEEAVGDMEALKKASEIVSEVEELKKPTALELTGRVNGNVELLAGQASTMECTVVPASTLKLTSKDNREVAELAFVDNEDDNILEYHTDTNSIVTKSRNR